MKWALVAAPVWLAWHRLWFALAIYLLIGVLVLALLFTPYWPAALLLAGFPALYLFLEGNQLRRQALERSGASILAIIDAPNAEVALARFADEFAPQTTPPVPVSTPSSAARPESDRPVFGLFAENGT